MEQQLSLDAASPICQRPSKALFKASPYDNLGGLEICSPSYDFMMSFWWACAYAQESVWISRAAVESRSLRLRWDRRVPFAVQLNEIFCLLLSSILVYGEDDCTVLQCSHISVFVFESYMEFSSTYLCLIYHIKYYRLSSCVDRRIKIRLCFTTSYKHI